MSEVPATPVAMSLSPSARLLARTTGAAGLLFLLVVLVWISTGSSDEPDFNGTEAEVVRFFRSISNTTYQVGSFMFALGTVALLWFSIGLSTVLARAEGELPWRSRVAAGSGVATVAVLLGSSWEAAAHRGDELTPGVATFAFDLGNAAFANVWLLLGSFTAVSSWVLLAETAVHRWIGWLGLLVGLGMVAARAVWTSPVWLAPYAAFWVWVVAVAVVLLRSPARLAPNEPPARTV